MIQKGLYLEFDRDEYAGRVARVRQEMAEAELDALFLTFYDNLVYFAGYRTWLKISNHRAFAVLLPLAGDPILFVPPMEAGDGMAFSWIEDMRVWRDDNDPLALWVEAIRECKLDRARIGIELGADMKLGMNYNDFMQFKAALPDVTWVDSAPIIWNVRMVKSPHEIARLQQSCSILDASCAAAWASLRRGVTQRDIARAIGVSMMANFADVPDFLIVRTGEDGWYMGNPMTSDREVKPGDIVHLDIGCIYRDYHSDFIRMACLGEPTTVDRKRHAEATLVAQAVREAIRPGMTIGELSAVRTRVTEELGAKPAWAGIGHCIGLSTHELPRIGPGPDEHIVLQPGMVFSVEPGLSYDGRIASIEDIVVVTDTGWYSLTNHPRELYVAPV